MPSSYLIPLQTAVNWTTAWRTSNPNSVKAFKIDLQEINDLLQETGTTAIRVYFGVENGAEKLILVAVNSAGQDIINPIVSGAKISGTYDFNSPCPPVCDPSSPLVTGIMPPN
ncbi:MAG: hypothetical protein JNJ57_07055 [Saprospiraceae bacterium]|nr:hypothetical protein [Saprospiraceae bacterium]